MSFEVPKRMIEGGAHDEANVLQAEVEEQKARESRKHGSPGDRESTAADYDNALAKLEELKRIIDAEPTSDKVIRNLANTVKLPAYAGFAVGAFLDRLIGTLSRNKNEYGRELDEKIMREHIDSLFSEEESRLRRMKVAGKKFGEEEGNAVVP